MALYASSACKGSSSEAKRISRPIQHAPCANAIEAGNTAQQQIGFYCDREANCD